VVNQLISSRGRIKISSSKEKYFDRWTLIAFIAFVFLGDITILSIPFLHGAYEDLGYTWFTDIWGFGTWVNYNRIDTDMTTSGSFRDLVGFSAVIIAFLFISIVMITVSIFFLGKNRWRNETLQRSAGGSVSLFAVIGLISVILFAIYHKNNSESYMTYFAGFYIALIFFSLVFLGGIKNIFITNQLSKPIITPPPTKEELLPEDKKDEKRSKLFDYIEEIDETAKEEY